MNNNENLNMDKAIDVDYEMENNQWQGGTENQNMGNNYSMNNQMGYQDQGNMGQMGQQNYNNQMPRDNQPSNGQMNFNNQNGNQGYNGQMNYNNQNGNQGYNNQMNFGNQNNQGQMGYQNQGYNPQMNQQGFNPMGNQNQSMNQQGFNQNQGMNQQGMNQSQGYMNFGNNNMGYQNQGMDMNSMTTQGNQMPMQDDLAIEVSEYKQRLRGMREVQALTGEVDIQNTNSIINFGQRASDSISKVSDQLLNSMKSVKAEEASEMLGNLTKIMDKFDVKELEDTKQSSMFSKLFKNVGNTVAKLFQKYDSMGYEVEKVYVLLRKYENDIKESNANLKRLYDSNLEFYRDLEKYIVAGEMAIEEIDGYLNQLAYDNSMNQEEKQMMIQKLEISKDMMSQRVYDLQIAENVAIQAAPMIQTIQMSNFNLMRKINSSFIVTLPIFKQCLAQAVILKRQEIQAKSIKQLDDKTNELIMRNAANTARQSVEIAKMSSGSSVAIETLQKSFETIMKGIEDTKAIQEANKQQRKENSNRLESMKSNMKRHIAEA